MTYQETPQFFLNRRGQRLFAILHAAPAHERGDIAVVYCAPLFEDKLWAHRVAVGFARFLAGKTLPVLRFDYYGDGESEGIFEEATVESRLDDIAAAIEFARAQTGCSRVVLVGLCYGATLALAAAERSDAVAGVVAWQPILDSERYLGDLLRANLTTQMVLHKKVLHDRETLIAQIRAGGTVNVEGYEIARPLFDQIAALTMADRIFTMRKPALIQQIAPSGNTEREYLIVESRADEHLQFQKIREIKFWTQQRKAFPACDELFERTADWIAHQPHQPMSTREASGND